MLLLVPKTEEDISDTAEVINAFFFSSAIIQTAAGTQQGF